MQIDLTPKQIFDINDCFLQCPSDIINLILGFLDLCYISNLQFFSNVDKYLKFRYNRIPWIITVDFELRSPSQLSGYEISRGYSIKHQNIFGARMFVGYDIGDVYNKRIDTSSVLGYDKSDIFVTRNDNIEHGKIPWNQLLGTDVHVWNRNLDNSQTRYLNCSTKIYHPLNDIKSAILSGVGGPLIEHTIKYHGKLKDFGKCKIQCKIENLENFRGIDIDVRPLINDKADKGYRKLNVFLKSRWKNDFRLENRKRQDYDIFKILDTYKYWPIVFLK